MKLVSLLKLLLLSVAISLSQQSIATEYTIYRGVFYQVTDDKVYKMENIDGVWMTTNEWIPLTKDGYIDGYVVTTKGGKK